MLWRPAAILLKVMARWSLIQIMARSHPVVRADRRL
jgi:hypothetical protein